MIALFAGHVAGGRGLLRFCAYRSAVQVRNGGRTRDVRSHAVCAMVTATNGPGPRLGLDAGPQETVGGAIE